MTAFFYFVFFCSPGDAVAEEVRTKKANLGVSGLYVTPERISHLDVSVSHSQDCASFISLTSTALPKYLLNISFIIY